MYLCSHSIIVSGSGEGAAQLANLPCGFINGDYIPGKEWEISTLGQVFGIYRTE